MIVASFLVKDLHLEWQHGARHFMRWLVDGDLASNQHGWQWTAGCGTDAAPYFRVFNPTSQGRKFDPDGAYVRRWVPELADVREHVHEPSAGTDGGPDGYPAPIVDHAEERREALDALREDQGDDRALPDHRAHHRARFRGPARLRQRRLDRRCGRRAGRPGCPEDRAGLAGDRGRRCASRRRSTRPMTVSTCADEPTAPAARHATVRRWSPGRRGAGRRRGPRCRSSRCRRPRRAAADGGVPRAGRRTRSPTCFACGTDRAEGDGLRIFPGPGRRPTAATSLAPWTPHPSVGEDFHAYVDDAARGPACRSPGPRWTASAAGPPTSSERLMVLGRMTARLDALPAIGEEHVVVGRARRGRPQDASPPRRCTTPTAGSSAGARHRGSRSTRPPSARRSPQFSRPAGSSGSMVPWLI